jgi:hypothetical protein
MQAVDWEAVEAAIGRLQADWTDALVEFCAIPSEGGRTDDLERAAQWTVGRLEHIGATPGRKALVVLTRSNVQRDGFLCWRHD